MKCTWAAAKRTVAVSSSAVEAVGIIFIADLVKPHTLRVLHTDCGLTEVVTALITIRTVIIVHTACSHIVLGNNVYCGF